MQIIIDVPLHHRAIDVVLVLFLLITLFLIGDPSNLCAVKCSYSFLTDQTPITERVQNSLFCSQLHFNYFNYSLYFVCVYIFLLVIPLNKIKSNSIVEGKIKLWLFVLYWYYAALIIKKCKCEVSILWIVCIDKHIGCFRSSALNRGFDSELSLGMLVVQWWNTSSSGFLPFWLLRRVV